MIRLLLIYNHGNDMKIHILGICGTFMGGIAAIARQLGHQVSGSDQHVYPPMSTFLEEKGIFLSQGFRLENLAYGPDLVVVGVDLKDLKGANDLPDHFMKGDAK